MNTAYTIKNLEVQFRLFGVGGDDLKRTYARLEEVVPQMRMKAFNREGTTKLTNLEHMCVCNSP